MNRKCGKRKRRDVTAGGGKTEKKNKEKSFLVFSYTAIRRLIYRVFLLILSKGISGRRHIVFFFFF